jgi:hypothetical protein
MISLNEVDSDGGEQRENRSWSRYVGGIGSSFNTGGICFDFLGDSFGAKMIV